MPESLSTNQPTGTLAQWWKEVRAILKQAWPLCLSYLGHMAMGLTDSIMVGRLGALELAATSLGATVFFTVFLFNMGIVMAVTPLASQYLGARNPRMMRRAVRQGLWAGVLVSLPGLFLLWHIEPILNLIGQPAELTRPLGVYMKAAMWALTPGVGYIAIRCFMTALGASKPIMIVTGLAVIGNILLNYGLIFGNFGLPRLELVGAGIATTTITLLEFFGLAAIALRLRPYRKFYIFGHIWRPDWLLFRRVFTLGIPIALGMLMEESFFMVTILMMGYVGTAEVAAHAMAVHLISIAYMVSIGIADAGCARIGNAFGRRDFAALRLSGWTALHIVWLITSCMAILLYSFPEQSAHIFLDKDLAANAATFAIAFALIPFAALIQMFDGSQLVMGRCLHGLSDTKAPMLINFCGFWLLGISVAYFFTFEMNQGVMGVWTGLYAASISTALGYLFRYFLVSRKAHERKIG